MNLRRVGLTALLLMGIIGGALALPPDAQSPKQDMKDAGHATKGCRQRHRSRHEEDGTKGEERDEERRS